MERIYSIGRVLRGGLEVLKRGFGLLALTLLVFSILPTAFSFGVILPALGGVATTAPGAVPSVNWGLLPLIYLLTSLFAAAQYAALLRASTLLLDGKRPRLADIAGHALRRTPFVFLLFLVLSIAIAIGFLLLIVPGVLLAIRWSAAIQVVSVEPVGVFGSLRRSNDLTRGSRLRTFLLFLVALALAVPEAITLLALNNAVGPAGMSRPGALIPYMIVSSLVALCSLAVMAAHYVELRRVRDQAAPERLAEVFA